jgi:argininosuccinate lyase
MWCRDQIDIILDQLCALRQAFKLMAEKHLHVVLPGCTHLQHAQPVLFPHHLLAYTEMFKRDIERFSQLRNRVNCMPLGSAAMAGTPYPIDRKQVAKELKFDSVSENSMDAVSDRDFAVEFCANASLTMMHLSRLCEELILWSTPEFGFITIGDAFTTGSSIMPQKKNPDVAELVRGKVGRVYGDLTALLTILKGLPMTYNRDLQEDKEPVFDASDTVQLCLAVMARMLPSINVHEDAMFDATQEGFLEATDLADYLAAKGLPFREAHEIVGKMVLDCTKKGLKLSDLSLDDLNAYSNMYEKDALKLMDPNALVNRRKTFGGTALTQVKKSLKKI